MFPSVEAETPVGGFRCLGDPKQTVYVWIDALFNYRTAIDIDSRRHFWPANVHLIAKDILWFHAVIWPCLLMALQLPLPGQIYTHSFWTAEGQKMSKSLGNFISMEQIGNYIEEFGLDAFRYFLTTQGPLGTTDSDFSHRKFVEVYNTDLANGLGNCVSRIFGMIGRYFDGRLPAPSASTEASADLRSRAVAVPAAVDAHYRRVAISAVVGEGLDLVRGIDRYIERTQPFRLANNPERREELGMILYDCAEALRIASIGFYPIMPNKIETLWRSLGVSFNSGVDELETWYGWGTTSAQLPRYHDQAALPPTPALKAPEATAGSHSVSFGVEIDLDETNYAISSGLPFQGEGSCDFRFRKGRSRRTGSGGSLEGRTVPSRSAV